MKIKLSIHVYNVILKTLGLAQEIYSKFFPQRFKHLAILVKLLAVTSWYAR
jgi:hypothetical protein